MKDTGFRKRAETESLRYGKDPWVLVRELGQNSRDAFASRIDASTHADDKAQTLIFNDDGRGMSFEHARRYLFRLYASSKEGNEFAAGRYGVGFWSVLLFNPDKIEIHSRTNKTHWAVSLSGDLQHWRNLPCRRVRPGTTVVLMRASTGSAGGFQKLSETAMIRYLSRLRTAGRKPKPLPVYFNSKNILRPFKLDSPASLAFSETDADGVVGFGKLPSYQLYARGLPVIRGSFLEELEGRHLRGRVDRERQGAAPVYLLNGNHLDVVLSRQTLINNRDLRRLVDTARRRFDQLVSLTVGCTVRRTVFGRIADALRVTDHAPYWVRWMFFLFLLFFLVTGLSALAWRLGKMEARSKSVDTVAIEPHGGMVAERLGSRAPAKAQLPESAPKPTQARQLVPAISPSVAQQVVASTVANLDTAPEWSLYYQPPKSLLFRLFALQHFDPHQGWQPAPMKQDWQLPNQPVDLKNQVVVSMQLEVEPGGLLLPVPSGYFVVPGSARIGKHRARLLVNQDGLLQVKVEHPYASRLTYRVAPVKKPGPVFALSDSEITLPRDLLGKLKKLKKLPMIKRARKAVQLVQRLVSYDRSFKTAKTYAAFSEDRNRAWVDKVLSVGAGDCDVMNGLLTAFLQRLGISARMVVGIVGNNGHGVSGWHAWVETAHPGLGVLDASMGSRLLDEGPVLPEPSSEPVAKPVTSTPAPKRADNEPGFVYRLFRSGQLARKVLWTVLGLLFIGVSWLLVHKWRRVVRSGQVAMTRDVRKRRKLLASMAVDAIQRPAAWREVPGLWHRPFIPCHGGRLISLSRLIQLATKDRLFIGSRDNFLTEDALRAGAWVLDRDDQDFAGFFAQVAHLRDLDELAKLNPHVSEQGSARRLAKDMHLFVRKVHNSLACRVVTPVEQGLFWDVDLLPVRPRSGIGWSSRFVGINPRHPWWQHLALVYDEDPDLALCVAIDHLSEVSNLLKPWAASLRRAVAAKALRSVG